MNKKFLRVLFSMSALLILGKGLGFVRTAMVASTYGAGFISDIYSFEDSFINEIYTIFATFLACSFIPKYLSLDNDNRNRLFSLILNLGTILMVLLSIGCLIFTEPLLKVLVPGYFNLYDIGEIIFVTRVNLIMLILTFLVNYFMTVLQAHEIFVYLSLESIILNVVVIFYLSFLSNIGLIGLLLCRVFAYIILLLLVIIRLKKIDSIHYYKIFDLRDRHLHDMFKVAIPMLGITVLWQLNYVIDMSMASGLESGSIACLNYAKVISMIIYNVVGYVISTYAYPVISKVQNDVQQVSKTFKEYFFILLNLVMPIAVLTMFFSGYVSKLLYGRGNMAESSVLIIANILVMYLPGSIAYCLKNLYSKLFYIKKDTKIVLILDVIGCVVNITLNLILVNVLGVYGLALATSISYCTTVILQLVIGIKKEYVVFSFSEFRNIGLELILLLMVGKISSEMISILPNNEVLKFCYVSVTYILMCILFSFKDLKKLTRKA